MGNLAVGTRTALHCCSEESACKWLFCKATYKQRLCILLNQQHFQHLARVLTSSSHVRGQVSTRRHVGKGRNRAISIAARSTTDHSVIKVYYVNYSTVVQYLADGMQWAQECAVSLYEGQRLRTATLNCKHYLPGASQKRGSAWTIDCVCRGVIACARGLRSRAAGARKRVDKIPSEGGGVDVRLPWTSSSVRSTPSLGLTRRGDSSRYGLAASEKGSGTKAAIPSLIFH